MKPRNKRNLLIVAKRKKLIKVLIKRTIEEIDHEADEIRGDWSDPRQNCRDISGYCQDLIFLLGCLGINKEVRHKTSLLHLFRSK